MEMGEEEQSCRILFMHCFQLWRSVHISALCLNAHKLISPPCTLALAELSPLSFASPWLLFQAPDLCQLSSSVPQMRMSWQPEVQLRNRQFLRAAVEMGNVHSHFSWPSALSHGGTEQEAFCISCMAEQCCYSGCIAWLVIEHMLCRLACLYSQSNMCSIKN